LGNVEALKARSAPPTFKTKLDRLYPRQDAPTQLALDYSPEEDAGLTLASLPASFLPLWNHRTLDPLRPKSAKNSQGKETR
jgi:hypothetical protein